MKSSIIVATLNEEKNIKQCLKSLFDQTQKASEIILVDSNSNDKTVEIASKFKIKIINSEKKGRSAARNIGWKHASQEIICFAEADSVFDKNWLKEILMEFENKADAVIDRRKLFQPTTFSQKTFDAHFDIRYSNYKPFSAWAFKKIILKKVNGFDEKMDFGEDRDLGTRILKHGYKIHLAKNAVQYHKGEPKSFFEFAKRSFVFGMEKSKFFHKKHPHTLPVKKMFFLIILSSLILLSFTDILFQYLLVSLLIVSYIAALFKTIFIEKALGIVQLKYVFGVAFLKILYSTFYALGVFRSYFFNR